MLILKSQFPLYFSYHLPTFASMYPDLHYFIEGLLGIDVPEWVGVFKTFGLFVALGFLASSYVLVLDLKRKEKLGILVPTYSTVEVGKPATQKELLMALLTGFIIGYKIGGMLLNWQTVSPNPMGYLFSLEGSFLPGLLVALFTAYTKYREKKKQELPTPKKQTIATYPHHRITELVVIAMVAGLGGAKIFNAFETWDDFIRNPIENLISSSGLTFYGGLITAGICIVWYARKHKIPVPVLLDSFAPVMMLAYAVGRLGCHFSGDGDWGVFNSAYITVRDGVALEAAQADQFLSTLHQNQQYLASLAHEFGGVQNIPHIYMPAPGWLPDWLLGMNYPYNVNNEGIFIPGCTGDYCHVLPVSVFPTSIYEFFACFILFIILWVLKNKFTVAGKLFGLYLIFNGLERFFIEKIRVNSRYDLGFIQPTQAEIISFFLVVLGILFIVLSRKKYETYIEEHKAQAISK
mgnify:CR=1 FL=1|jgi:phosphatidylglycerol:prolipoprotein diacylglycerol transferase